MADNVTLNAGAGGDIVAADDVGGIKYQRVKIAHGADGSASDARPDAPVPVTSPVIEIARGARPTWTTVNKFGRNTDVDAAEDIWEAPTASWVAPTTARTHQVASTSVNDDVGGTGATSVTVYGLDENYALVSEVIAMDGTTNVATSETYVMIYRMVVTAAGSGGSNAGVITATADTDATVTAQIAVGENQTQMAIFQVPASTQALVFNYYAAANRAVTTGAVDVALKVMPFGEVWQTKHTLGLNMTGATYFNHVFGVPLVLTEKSLIKIAATPSAVNFDVSAGFDAVLIPTTEFAPA